MPAGWQQAPRRTSKSCPHLGYLFAAVGAGLHDVGHEWHCTCGRAYIVVKTPDGNRLVPKR